MSTPDEPGQPLDPLVAARRELAAARQRLEVLEEDAGASRRADHQLAQLAKHLDARLSRQERRSQGVRGWVKRRLRRNALTPAEYADAKELRASRLFNGIWYLSTYPEVARTGLSPALHYLRLGAAEGKDPSPDFSTKHYQSVHPQLARIKVNPLLHHIRTGQ